MGDRGMEKRKTKFFEYKSQLPEERDVTEYSKKIISKISCKNFGFECNFMTDEDLAEVIIKEFREHAKQDHFIDYPEGVLMKSLMREK